MDKLDRFEELIELLYWEFDAERSKGSRSERDIFKGKMRYLANEVLHSESE